MFQSIDFPVCPLIVVWQMHLLEKLQEIIQFYQDAFPKWTVSLKRRDFKPNFLTISPVRVIIEIIPSWGILQDYFLQECIRFKWPILGHNNETRLELEPFRNIFLSFLHHKEVVCWPSLQQIKDTAKKITLESCCCNSRITAAPNGLLTRKKLY